MSTNPHTESQIRTNPHLQTCIHTKMHTQYNAQSELVYTPIEKHPQKKIVKIKTLGTDAVYSFCNLVTHENI